MKKPKISTKCHKNSNSQGRHFRYFKETVIVARRGGGIGCSKRLMGGGVSLLLEVVVCV